MKANASITPPNWASTLDEGADDRPDDGGESRQAKGAEVIGLHRRISQSGEVGEGEAAGRGEKTTADRKNSGNRKEQDDVDREWGEAEPDRAAAPGCFPDAARGGG
jgi:hypothetical protein